MPDRIERIKAFLKDAPADCFLNHAIALEYVKAGDEESARTHFELNLGNDPGYIATYYHLGKLLERLQLQDEAVKIYVAGMEKAKAAKDMHTYNELQGGDDDLVD